MKVGIFGGSFNPVHLYHLYIAKEALRQCNLDEVWFVPVYKPVHKKTDSLLDYSYRKDLLQTAINNYFPNDLSKKFIVSDLELQLESPCYTYNLINYCIKKFKNFKFYKIIGSDSLFDMPNWYNYSELCKLIPFIIAPRDSSHQITNLPNSNSFILSIKIYNCSSSTIRKKLHDSNFKNIYLLPSVIAKIIHNNLFDCLGKDYKVWIYKIKLQVDNLETSLKNHIYNVALLASEFAYKLNLDPRNGYLAGLTHDLFRLSDNNTILNHVSKCKFTLSEEELHLPMLAHGKASAAYLKSLNPTPPFEVIEAVVNHTFPPTNYNTASPLTKALVLADALDPSRNDKTLQSILHNHNLSLDEKYNEITKYKLAKADLQKNKIHANL